MYVMILLSKCRSHNTKAFVWNRLWMMWLSHWLLLSLLPTGLYNTASMLQQEAGLPRCTTPPVVHPDNPLLFSTPKATTTPRAVRQLGLLSACCLLLTGCMYTTHSMHIHWTHTTCMQHTYTLRLQYTPHTYILRLQYTPYTYILRVHYMQHVYSADFTHSILMWHSSITWR